jgi:cation diffusion facilitator family transporter
MTRSPAGSKSTRRTVLVAGAANVVVAVAKLAAGLMTGSSAMLAETAHSAADTLNQAFLLTSLHRGDRPADERHPFGHGQERYFWSLLSRPSLTATTTSSLPIAIEAAPSHTGDPVSRGSRRRHRPAPGREAPGGPARLHRSHADIART